MIINFYLIKSGKEAFLALNVKMTILNRWFYLYVCNIIQMELSCWKKNINLSWKLLWLSSACCNTDLPTNRRFSCDFLLQPLMVEFPLTPLWFRRYFQNISYYLVDPSTFYCITNSVAGPAIICIFVYVPYVHTHYLFDRRSLITICR